MKISDLFFETYSALMSNRTRSGLTILGIVIGIGSVITMIAIGQGSQSTIENSIQSLGSNLIMVSPGMQKRGVGTQVRGGQGSATTLTLEDSEAIETQLANLLKNVAPVVLSRYQVTAKGTNTNTTVTGVTENYTEVKNVEMAVGSFISTQNNAAKAKVAVLGPTTVSDLFGEDAEVADCIGQTVRISSMNFKIIGVTESKGSSGMNNSDDIIYIPIATAQQYLSGSKSVSTINVQAVDESSMTALENGITSLLLEQHGITDSASADFTVLNQSDIVEAASSVTETFTLLLGSVAAISLLVGGIGIMNMMLTNVTERTREIGLRKAIGATRSDINMQFLFEAVTLTFVGGILGVFFGWLAALLINKFAGVATTVSWYPILLAFGVSAIIGVVFGYYPARRASNLNPIQALRYE